MLKLRRFSFLLAPLLTVACTVSVFADASFDAFWSKFKTAVAKKDKKAVASMTKLPYSLDFKQLNQAQFIAHYDQIISKGTVKCFARAKPVMDKGNYFVNCGEQIFCFNKEKDKWLFTEIGVND